MQKSTVFALILLCLILGSLAAVARLSPPTQPCPNGCNVIVIAVDTLSAKHLSVYGYERDTMPRTEAFFADDFIFDEAYSVSPWTLPSFSSMYFSDLPTNITFKDLDNRPNLLSELRNNNYTIRAILSPYEQFILDAIYRPFSDSEQTRTTDTFNAGFDKLTELTTDGTPFMLWMHTFEVHDPYAPKSPYDEHFEKLEGYEKVTMDDLVAANQSDEQNPERDRAYALRYDQGLASLDDRLGGFLERLPQDILDSTVIIVTSDHGEAFGEHGKVWHANNLHNEELHVPLFIRVPGTSGRRISDPVSLLDLTPTIFTLTRTAHTLTVLGADLTPSMLEEKSRDKPLLFVNGFPYFLSKEQVKPGFKPPASLAEVGVEGSEKHVIERSSIGARYYDLKVVSHSSSSEESISVFDLRKDPGEKSPLEIGLDELPVPLRDAFHSLENNALPQSSAQ